MNLLCFAIDQSLCVFTIEDKGTPTRVYFCLHFLVDCDRHSLGVLNLNFLHIFCYYSEASFLRPFNIAFWQTLLLFIDFVHSSYLFLACLLFIHSVHGSYLFLTRPWTGNIYFVRPVFPECRDYHIRCPYYAMLFYEKKNGSHPS